MTHPAIRVTNLIYRYPDGTPALNGVTLEIPQGARTVLLGPNGAGKSTLMLHLNGLLEPLGGEVHVEGRSLAEGGEDWVRQRVGMVFQDPDDQVFSATVEEDVAFGPRNLGLAPGEVARRVRAVLARLRLEALAGKAPQHLSYGEKRRVALAGVLAMEPVILILDEPLAFLDPGGQRILRGILDELSKEGKTLIVATHDVDFAAEWADHVIILKRGRVWKEGGKEILLDPALVEEAGLDLPLAARIFWGYDLPHGQEPPLCSEEARRILASLTEQRGLRRAHP